MNHTGTTLTIEAAAAKKPQNAARIKFYTEQRRVDFGRYLFRTAERIRAERTAAKNDTKNKESKNK